MASYNEISVSVLARLVGTPECPVLLDVRIDEDFANDPMLIPGACRHSFLDVAALVDDLVGRSVIVYCQKGLKISQGAAAVLRNKGVKAVALEGGQFSWRDVGHLMVSAKKIPPLNSSGSTVWVTRHRPKIDRIACPWLIRRFIDLKAQILFVSEGQVNNVAERFSATPFDIKDVFWSHRGDACTLTQWLKSLVLATMHSLILPRSCGAKKSLSRKLHWLIAALAFIGIFFLSIPYSLIVLIAAVFGFLIGSVQEERSNVGMGFFFRR